MMADKSKIEWTDATFNPWIGCTKVSPACHYCYAERDFDLRRHVVKWRAGQTPAMTFLDAVRRAADLLADHAEGLRRDHTRPDDRDDWGEDTDVREHYEQILEVIGALNRGR